jgi:hypothetical protein
MIVVPYRISREYIISHPELVFVHSRCFWPNIWVGPSLICKGLDNCYGVPVRWKLCKSSGYFQDSQQESIEAALKEAIAQIPTTCPVILFPKIGNGDSRMNIFAPRCWAYMMQQLNAIKGEYRYDYSAQ